MNYICHYKSPLGGITLASNGKNLVGLWFDGQKYYADTLESDISEKKLPIFDQTFKWLDTYFSGKVPNFTPSLFLRTTTFRKEVCEILMTIPYGHIMTYGEISKILAKRHGLARMSAQAVGGAVGHNPIALIIPCHRVIGANGSLTGYAGGLDKKEKLLAMEKATLIKGSSK